MKIDRSYLGNQNTYAENNPKCIVVHNTDNFAAGADARAHARAQHDGNFQNISAHYYVDDGDTAYQAAPHSRGCWHVGINYGGKNLFQQYGNKNSIGVEMCVQEFLSRHSGSIVRSGFPQCCISQWDGCVYWHFIRCFWLFHGRHLDGCWRAASFTRSAG